MSPKLVVHLQKVQIGDSCLEITALLEMGSQNHHVIFKQNLGHVLSIVAVYIMGVKR